VYKPMTDETKRCCRCKQPKPLTEFNKDSGARDGLNARCKPCHRVAALAWKKSAKGKASARKYYYSKGKETGRLWRQRKKESKLCQNN